MGLTFRCLSEPVFAWWKTKQVAGRPAATGFGRVIRHSL